MQTFVTFSTLDKLINSLDGSFTLKLDVDDSTFDCDFSGRISCEDGKRYFFYLNDDGRWALRCF